MSDGDTHDALMSASHSVAIIASSKHLLLSSEETSSKVACGIGGTDNACGIAGSDRAFGSMFFGGVCGAASPTWSGSWKGLSTSQGTQSSLWGGGAIATGSGMPGCIRARTTAGSGVPGVTRKAGGAFLCRTPPRTL